MVAARDRVNEQPKKGHRDPHRSFYTDDRELVSYMVELLDPVLGDRVLEPCAGSGLFVEQLLTKAHGVTVDAVDIDSNALKTLRKRFAGSPTVTVIDSDFLLDFHAEDCQGKYDKIIANPPYGAWQTPERRKELKRQFPDLYVKESAALFLDKAVSLLREGGRAVFILPETFLFSHSHRALRARLLQSCEFESVDLFPSSLFPGVSFGYARLSIVSLKKGTSDGRNLVRIHRAPTMRNLVERCGDSALHSQMLIEANPELAFPVNGAFEVNGDEVSGVSTLGEVANCVTGFYSGDDARFLRRAPGNSKYAVKYKAVTAEKIAQNAEIPLAGIIDSAHYVPVLKGGGFSYFKPMMWFMDWSEAAVKHYKSDRKARFQNSSYYFRRGIGFPMVSSGTARASIIPPSHLFDQSIVGIFPKQETHFWYLLALLNSDTAWTLLRKINPSTNNSAKYMRRLPVVLPNGPDAVWFDTTVESYVRELAHGSSRSEALERDIAARVREVMQPVLSSLNDAQLCVQADRGEVAPCFLKRGRAAAA